MDKIFLRFQGPGLSVSDHIYRSTQKFQSQSVFIVVFYILVPSRRRPAYSRGCLKIPEIEGFQHNSDREKCETCGQDKPVR